MKDKKKKNNNRENTFDSLEMATDKRVEKAQVKS